MLYLRNCPLACKPDNCFCKIKDTVDRKITSCEEMENNGLAGWYSDETIGWHKLLPRMAHFVKTKCLYIIPKL